MKVITFSRNFPTTHPKKGEPTHFVRSIWEGLDMLNYDLPLDDAELESEIKEYFTKLTYTPKWHTIRAGHRWKVGDWFSPRIWSGKPYSSKQIEIAACIEIKKVFDIKMEGYHIWINKELFSCACYHSNAMELAMNDGLHIDDFWNWFPAKAGRVFAGQILCWNEEINY